MAKHTSNRRRLTVDGTDLTTYVEGLTLKQSAPTLDVTGQGAANRVAIADLAVVTLSGSIWMDYTDTTGPWSVISAAFGTAVTCTVLPDTAIVTETSAAHNPLFTCDFIISEIEHVNGKVGEVAKYDFEWTAAGALTWT